MEAASPARIHLVSHVDAWNRSISLPGGGRSGKRTVCVGVQWFEREDDSKLEKMDERDEDK